MCTWWGMVRNFTSGNFSVATRPAHKHFLSNTISRAKFVSNIGKLHIESKEISNSLQF